MQEAELAALVPPHLRELGEVRNLVWVHARLARMVCRGVQTGSGNFEGWDATCTSVEEGVKGTARYA